MNTYDDDGTERGTRTERIPGSSDWIVMSDCVKVARDKTRGVLGADRVLESPSGFRWDAPGARVRFRTDSETVAVELIYLAKHVGPARNSVGFYRVDGAGRAEWWFTRPEGGAGPADAGLVLRLPVPMLDPGTGRAFHDYELILPYGDAVEIGGVVVTAGARWEAPTKRGGPRWVAFGDSVTQGFTASSVARSYAFVVGETLGWQVINAGIGGRGTQATDGAFLGDLDGDVFSIAIGVNDWQGGVVPQRFREEMDGLLSGLRDGKPTALVYVITPLWVPPSWRPEGAMHTLEVYREVIREVVAKRADARMQVVDGPSLIDADAVLFDAIAVHPNDAGFAQMSERLVSVFNRRNVLPCLVRGKR